MGCLRRPHQRLQRRVVVPAAFQDQLRAQAVEQGDRAAFEGPTVLLCSEATADRCHRRLVAEHLARHWTDLHITHL